MAAIVLAGLVDAKSRPRPAARRARGQRLLSKDSSPTLATERETPENGALDRQRAAGHHRAQRRSRSVEAWPARSKSVKMPTVYPTAILNFLFTQERGLDGRQLIPP